MKRDYFILPLMVMMCSCADKSVKFDAQGNFEAIEVIVSSEGNGKIIEIDIEEGDILSENDIVGCIDTIQLQLKKMELEAVINVMKAKLPDVASQVNVIKEQLVNAEIEKARTERLIETKAVPLKQLDDWNAKIALLERQVKSMNSQLNTQTRSLLAEIEPLKVKIAQIDDNIKKCKIVSPIKGTVLTKYAQKGELATIGKPLYKIADVSEIILKAYLAGDQLSVVKIGQTVKVYIDSLDGNYKEYSGIITSVSDKAEFAPKVIQTKDERVNLVYGFKVIVQNDGAIKIGMPGEIKF